MTTTQTFTEEYVEIGGGRTHMYKGGSGAPILYLHSAGANPGWADYIDGLARSHTVYVPSHPGYDNSDRLPWVNTINDTAHFYIGLMSKLGLEGVTLVGHSMGGWIAAEIAAMDSRRVKAMVLVDPVGVKPQNSEITEVLMVGPAQTKSMSWYDENKAPNLDDLPQEKQDVLWRNREMASRLLWKPYMHNPHLPDYLGLVSLPTLIVFGKQDGIVPLEVGEIYHQILGGSRLHIIDKAGHSPQIEQTKEFLDVTSDFLSKL